MDRRAGPQHRLPSRQRRGGPRRRVPGPAPHRPSPPGRLRLAGGDRPAPGGREPGGRPHPGRRRAAHPLVAVGDDAAGRGVHAGPRPGHRLCAAHGEPLPRVARAGARGPGRGDGRLPSRGRDRGAVRGRGGDWLHRPAAGAGERAALARAGRVARGGCVGADRGHPAARAPRPGSAPASTGVGSRGRAPDSGPTARPRPGDAGAVGSGATRSSCSCSRARRSSSSWCTRPGCGRGCPTGTGSRRRWSPPGR